MEDDATRWDHRYADSDLSVARAPDVFAEHPELVGALPDTGTALDLACGTGAQVLWLAERGLQVRALDVSPVAVALAQRSARRAGCTVDARVADLDAGLPADITPGGDGGFDVILCQRFRQPELYAPIIDHLRPGGVAVVTVLSAVGLAGERGPFHAAAGELRTAFTLDDVEMLLDVERDGLASVVVRRR